MKFIYNAIFAFIISASLIGCTNTEAVEEVTTDSQLVESALTTYINSTNKKSLAHIDIDAKTNDANYQDVLEAQPAELRALVDQIVATNMTKDEFFAIATDLDLNADLSNMRCIFCNDTACANSIALEVVGGATINPGLSVLGWIGQAVHCP